MHGLTVINCARCMSDCSTVIVEYNSCYYVIIYQRMHLFDVWGQRKESQKVCSNNTSAFLLKHAANL